MSPSKCLIYTNNICMELIFKDTLLLTSNMCKLPGQSITFFCLTKVSTKIVLSDISSEIVIRFSNCSMPKSELVLDDNFTLQFSYKGISFQVYVILFGKNSNKQFTDSRSLTRLPFCIPTVCNYPFFAAVLGILETHNCAKEWLISNYLLPWCHKEPCVVPYWVDFRFGEEEKISEWCPLLNIDILSRDFIKKEYGSPIDAFKHFISQNRYAYISYNAYYVDDFWSKGEHRYPYKHQCLVLGYDDKQGHMLIADFFNGIYKTTKISYENFILAYDTYNQTNNIPQKNLTDEANDQSKTEYLNNLETLELEYGHEIKLLSLNQNSPKIDYMLMYGLTQDFINGTDTTIYTEYSINMQDKLSFGFEFFIEIRKYLQKCMAEKTHINLKPFYIIQKFNHVMKIRAEILQINNQHFLAEMDEALKYSSTILYTLMKYNIKKNDIQMKILEKYDSLTTLEFSIVKELSNILEACYLQNPSL